MPNRADGLPNDEAPQSEESAPGMGLAEFRALLADLRREFPESDEGHLVEAIEPTPSSAALQLEDARSSARRTAIAAYAAAATPLPEAASVSEPPSFERILEDRLSRIETPPPMEDEPTPAPQPDSAFGQRFRARRRAMGRGCSVR